jgi:aryl-alcohol dehydrogenase-like predicted oxidoreductase
MITTNIPNTSLAVSPICLGTSQMGTALDYDAACQILDTFVEHGGSFLDTAHIYGDWVPDIERNICERTIGRWLSERGQRDNIVIATKGAHWTFDAPEVSRVTARDILVDIDESLQCLATNFIDFYWLHRDDTSQPVGALLEPLEAQRRAGKIRWYGASNWSAPRIKEANEYASSSGLSGFIASQVYWNAAVLKEHPFADPGVHVMDKNLYEFHRATGLAAIPYQSQAGGLFSKLLSARNDGSDWVPGGIFAPEPCAERMTAIERVMKETGLTVTQTVLGFLRSQPFPTIPIVGCRTTEQVIDSMSATRVRLNEDQLTAIGSPPWHGGH